MVILTYFSFVSFLYSFWSQVPPLFQSMLEAPLQKKGRSRSHLHSTAFVSRAPDTESET